jgi:hypothetical protein
MSKIDLFSARLMDYFSIFIILTVVLEGFSRLFLDLNYFKLLLRGNWDRKLNKIKIGKIYMPPTVIEYE